MHHHLLHQRFVTPPNGNFQLHSWNSSGSRTFSGRRLWRGWRRWWRWWGWRGWWRWWGWRRWWRWWRGWWATTTSIGRSVTRQQLLQAIVQHIILDQLGIRGEEMPNVDGVGMPVIHKRSMDPKWQESM